MAVVDHTAELRKIIESATGDLMDLPEECF